MLVLLFLLFSQLTSCVDVLTKNAGFSGDGGLATSAEFNSPCGIAVDSSGNVYIADSNNNRIREIKKSTGIIITIAGTGIAGYSGDGSKATSATFYNPLGVTVDSSENVYIADANNNRIREITKSTDIISTIAGTGIAGFSGDKGDATSAKLYCPHGIAVDSTGNVYIADTNNHCIRKVTASSGIITTIAGTGTASFSGDEDNARKATLYSPYGLAVDSSGNVYIADTYNNRIRKVTVSTDVISTIAGTCSIKFRTDGATSATLNHPYGVALDTAGNLYISDTNNNRMRKVLVLTGVITTIAGSNTSTEYGHDEGAATSATLNYPWGVTVDTSGNVYFATGSNVIRKIAVSTPGIISTIAGSSTSGYSDDGGDAKSVALYLPYGIPIDSSENVYIADIADVDNNRIRKITNSTGIISTIAGKGTAGRSGYVSFSTLIGYTVNVSHTFVYLFMYFILPVIAVVYVYLFSASVYNNENSEFQTIFYCFFSGLSTVNMIYDFGNVFSSCFSNYRYLWASIVVTWILPSLYFFVSTIVQHRLLPYFITDSYIGWWCLYKRYNIKIFLLWLGQSRGLPLINSKRLKIFENHDSLPKVLIYIIVWLVLITVQLACLIPLLLWSLVLLPYTAMLFIIGLFLFQTKLLVHQAVWNRWSALFTSRSLWYDKNAVYDTKYFNVSLALELLFNNIPQLVIKLLNNSYIDKSLLFPQYAFASPWMSIIVTAIGVVRYIFLPLVYGHHCTTVPFYIKLRLCFSRSYRFGIKKTKCHWTLNYDMRKAFIDYYTNVCNNGKADVLYERTHKMLIHTFVSADDVDQVDRTKRRREPLLLALRTRGLYHISTLQMAAETITMIQRDSVDNKVYRYLRSIEIRDPIDLIYLTSRSKAVVISHINNYKVRQLVTANLNLLALNNIGIRHFLTLNSDTNGGVISSKFLLRSYHHLMFPLVKTECGHADVGIHTDSDGLYVCELNELSLKIGLMLYDRVLLVNETPVSSVDEFNILVAQSNRNNNEYNTHNQICIVVARVNERTSVESIDNLVLELHETFDKSTDSRVTGGYKNKRRFLLNMKERELLKIFNIIDCDGNGMIEANELQVFLEHSGLGGTKTARKIIDLADGDGDGYVTSAEFLSVMKLIQGNTTKEFVDSDYSYDVLPDACDDIEDDGTNKSEIIMQDIDSYINDLNMIVNWHELKRSSLSSNMV